VIVIMVIYMSSVDPSTILSTRPQFRITLTLTEIDVLVFVLVVSFFKN
jgi:hypothetical protein